MSSVRRARFLKYHRWIGLFVGIFVLVQGLTGTLIAFRYELNRALHPAAMIVAPAALSVPLATLLKAAQTALPGYKVSRIDYPRAPDDAYIARLADKAGNLAIATLNRAGQVTRAAPLSGWPVEFTYQLHTGFFYGGEPMMGFVGLAVIIMAATGLVVWWPQPGRWRQAFRTDISNVSRAPRALHRLLGTVFSLLLLLLATTGLLMAWTDWAMPLVAAVIATSQDGAPVPPKMPCATPVKIDKDVATAMAARPGEAIKSIRLQAKGRVVAVYFQSPITFPTRVTDHVWLNACDARILAVNDQSEAKAGNWFFNWLLPIHSGDWLGLPGRLLSWSVALVILFMGLSGYWLWLVRAGQQRRARLAKKARL